MAGLAAARALVARGRSVRVLEARDRVGGRTLSHRTAHHEIVDLGAQWLGPTQHRLDAVVTELGLTKFPQHHEGKKVLALGDRIHSYSTDIPSLSLLALLDFGRTINRLESLAKTVDLEDPARTPNALRLDATTLEAWRQKHVLTRDARAMVEVVTKAIFGVEPWQLSLLFFLTYLRSGGGLMRLSTIPDGAQQTRVAEGFQTICQRWAEALGDRVTLSAPVRAISTDEASVEVVTNEERVRAKRVIVAIPPALAGRISYEPPLPVARDQLAQRMPMGSVIKCVAFYERPFWPNEGWSGEAVADAGPVRIVCDDSPADGRTGALLGFVSGNDALVYGDGPRASGGRRCSRSLGGSSASARGRRPTTWTTTGAPNPTAAAATRACSAPASSPRWARRCERRWGAFTGREQRQPSSTWDTWTAPSPPASAPPMRFSPRCDPALIPSVGVGHSSTRRLEQVS